MFHCCTTFMALPVFKIFENFLTSGYSHCPESSHRTHHPTAFPRGSAVCRFMMSGIAGERPGSAHSHWLIPVSYLLLNIVSITPRVHLLIKELKSQTVTLPPFHCLLLPPTNSLSVTYVHAIISTSGLKQPEVDPTRGL